MKKYYLSFRNSDHILQCVLFQSYMKYGDLFYDTWKAFSDYPFTHLKEYDGKTVNFFAIKIVTIVEPNLSFHFVLFAMYF